VGKRAGQPFTHTLLQGLHHLDEVTLVLHHRVDVIVVPRDLVRGTSGEAAGLPCYLWGWERKVRGRVGSRPLGLLRRSGEFYRLRAAPVHLRSCASYDQPQAPFRRGAIARRGEDTWGHRQDDPAHELG
jgi:hypothetical protein